MLASTPFYYSSTKAGTTCTPWVHVATAHHFPQSPQLKQQTRFMPLNSPPLRRAHSEILPACEQLPPYFGGEFTEFPHAAAPYCQTSSDFNTNICQRSNNTNIGNPNNLLASPDSSASRYYIKSTADGDDLNRNPNNNPGSFFSECSSEEAQVTFFLLVIGFFLPIALLINLIHWKCKDRTARIFSRISLIVLFIYGLTLILVLGILGGTNSW